MMLVFFSQQDGKLKILRKVQFKESIRILLDHIDSIPNLRN